MLFVGEKILPKADRKKYGHNMQNPILNDHWKYQLSYGTQCHWRASKETWLENVHTI